MEKKNVYVLSSLHFPSCGDVGSAKAVLGDILEVRRGVLESIARSVESCAYFSDRLTQDIVDCNLELFDLIDNFYRSLPSEEKDSLNLDDLTSDIILAPLEEGDEENPAYYDHGSTLCTISRLRLLGYRVNLKATENEEVADIKERDKVIYGNVKRSGEQHNILFIGQDHQLEDLVNSDELKVYRVEIRLKARHMIRVFGSLPISMEDNYKNFLETFNAQPDKEIVSNVEFVDVQ